MLLPPWTRIGWETRAEAMFKMGPDKFQDKAVQMLLQDVFPSLPQDYFKGAKGKSSNSQVLLENAGKMLASLGR
ncbi:unnamed protein product [Amoebophrya sp. A25]|nr:unnamed protein product [Amoebophrya sp. A25]|eukprot:GSA25T00018107001.1